MRVFILRQLTTLPSLRVFTVREVDSAVSDSYDLGIAFGLDHARRMIARWCLDFPESW